MPKEDIDRTLWVGNVSEKATEELLYELFLQAGPLDKVAIAKEKDGRQKNFAFVTFSHNVSVPYTIQLMDGMPLFGRSLRLQSRPGSIHQQNQQQQQMETLRHNSNPYQNNSPVSQRPLQQQPLPLLQNPLTNPYMNQPMRTHQTGMSPQFQRSHTWHGSDLSSASGQMERERDMRGGRDGRGHQGRENYDRNQDRGNAHRDRSGGRYRGDRIEDYRHSPNNDNFDSRRKRVLEKQDKMLQGHSRDSRHHHGRKGRY